MIGNCWGTWLIMLGFMDLGWPRVCRRLTSVLYWPMRSNKMFFLQWSELLPTLLKDLLGPVIIFHRFSPVRQTVLLIFENRCIFLSALLELGLFVGFITITFMFVNFAIHIWICLMECFHYANMNLSITKKVVGCQPSDISQTWFNTCNVISM